MARTRNISMGVTPELHAQYAARGLDARREVLDDLRIWLAQRLTAGRAEIGRDGAVAPTHGSQPSAVRSGATRPATLAEGQGMEPIDLPANWSQPRRPTRPWHVAAPDASPQ
jgi:hypothetical protein